MVGSRIPLLLAGLAGGLLFLLVAHLSGARATLEEELLDARFALRARPQDSVPISVVMLRGERFDSAHRSVRYPLADLLSTLADLPEDKRPAAILVDMVLAQAAEGPSQAEALQRIISAQARLKTVVQGMAFSLRESEFMDEPRATDFLLPQSLPPNGFRATGTYGIRLAHPDFQKALYQSAAAVGFVNLSPETDGLKRNLHAIPLLMRHQALPAMASHPGVEPLLSDAGPRLYPSLALAGAAVALCGGRPLADCLHPAPEGLRLEGLSPRIIPLDPDSGHYWINHRRRFDGLQLPASSQGSEKVAPEMLRFGPVEGLESALTRLTDSPPTSTDKLPPESLAHRCLLVMDALEPRTTLTPLGRDIPQATVHAQVLSSLLSGEHLLRPPLPVQLGWVLLPLLLNLLWRSRTWRAASVPGGEISARPRSVNAHILSELSQALPELGLALLWLFLGTLALSLRSVWLPLASPLTLLLGAFVGWRVCQPYFLRREQERLAQLLAQREALIAELKSRAHALEEERLTWQESHTTVPATSALDTGLETSESTPSESASSESASPDGLAASSPHTSALFMPDTELQALDRLLKESVELVSRQGGTLTPRAESPARTPLLTRLRDTRDAVAQTLQELKAVDASLERLKPTGERLRRFTEARLQAQSQLMEASRSTMRELVGELVRLQTPLAQERSTSPLPSGLELPLFEQTGILTGDPHLLRLLADVTTRLARSEAPVLILGETGTGKELIARALHQNSLRSARPLIVLNCAALNAGVLESELFGHVKGAFTGALKDHKGVFEEADQGTLFLDELGEMPLDMQARLLRALEYGEIQPVGGDHASRKKVNVRLLTATHANLPERVANRSFREDLYFRINTLTVQLPPLRARDGDIERLSQHFLAREGEVLNRTFTLEPEALRLLSLRHPWPGNVRELRAAMRRLATLARDERITAADVQEYLRLGMSASLPRSEHLLFDEQERYKLHLQRQHQFSATRCEQDEKYGAGRQTASRHLRVWMAKALWWTSWDQGATLRTLAGDEDALVDVLRPSLETFLSNLQEKLSQEPFEGDGQDSALHKSLKTHYRGDAEHVWRVVMALKSGWIQPERRG